MTSGKVIFGWGLLLALTLAAPAYAGTVYRCETPDGSRTYASNKIKGAKCSVISSYTPSAAAVRSAPITATTTRSASEAPATTPRTGAVIEATSVAGSPATLQGTVAESAPVAMPATPRVGTTRRVEGQVYSYIKDGVRNYTSKQPKGVAGATAIRAIRYSFVETCYACAALPGVNFGTLRLNMVAYAGEIRAAATQHGVDEAIVRAIIHAESSFNPNARSRVGAQGLMQLMPPTARRFGVSNAYDPAQNIGGGVQYLAWLLKRYNGDLTLAAAGYNAGEGAVDKYKGVPPYSETRRYVERVRVLAERYRGILAGRG